MAPRTCTSSSFASFLFLMSVAPALACAEDEATLFSCVTSDPAKFIQLCAVRDEAAGGYQTLQYRYGTETAPELVFPEDRRRGKSEMAFAHAFDKSTYVWSLRFANKGYTYRIFGEGDASAVEVWKNKKRLAQVMCNEKPYSYPDDIRRASTCDLKNPFGKAGCESNAPERK
jgi:hypothetical protein